MKSMTSTNPKKSRWGIGIFALYGGFVVFILICVAFASMQDFDLVEPDYYQKGLDYQDQINRVNRTVTSGTRPAISFDSSTKTFVISFPSTIRAEELSGTITLFRPSNADWDRTVLLNIDSNNQQLIPADQLANGRWKIKVGWKMDDSGYYAENFFDLE